MFPVPSFVSTCPSGGYLWHLSHSSRYVTHYHSHHTPLLPMSESLSLLGSLTDWDWDWRLVTVPLRPSVPAPGYRDQGRDAAMTHRDHHPVLSFVGFTLLKCMFVIGDSSLIMLWLNCAVAVPCPEKDRHLSPVSGSTLPPSLPLRGYTNKSCRVTWDHCEF